jgi:uncharacterized protein YhbP (UPF0306 family)
VAVIKRSHKRVAERKMTNLLRSLLDASTLCAIATVTPAGNAHINTAYFAWTPDFALVWLSAPAARHSRNLRATASAAIAVFKSTQVWGNPDRGVQIFGMAKEATGTEWEEAERAYRARIPDAGPTDVLPYRFYVLRTRKVKLFDERKLGPGVFVTARVRSDGRLEWERTEIYETREWHPTTQQ